MTTFTTPTRHTNRAAGLHYAEAPVRQRTVLTCGSWRRVPHRLRPDLRTYRELAAHAERFVCS